MSEARIRGVLFDLDGTLADTAPDLGGALNRLRVEQGLSELPAETLRPHTSAGARGLIGAGFGITPDDPRYAALAERFLTLYESALCVDTRLFDGMGEVLTRLEQAGIPWGVVTNKAARFTVPLMRELGLHERASSIVSGDSVPVPKPDPAGLRLAASEMDVDVASCLYVGDDERDILAARAASMPSVTAAFGYLGCARHHSEWGADHTIHHPLELLTLL
ncbi:MAG: HAD-IA family hydrolase [Methyloversatilis sp.]|nr:HAD-IA family hydrolase [Methyloversatilis sp.]